MDNHSSGPIRVGIAGSSGYVGGELLRLLLQHPEVAIGSLTGNSTAGETVGRIHPHLSPLADRRIQSLEDETFDDDDVVFLALPHGESAAVANRLAVTKPVLDCSADFRLADAQEWSHFYGGGHAGTWPYGLPELPGAREQIRGTRRVAVPGCYPTSSALAMYPALSNGLIDPDVVIVASSGSSGAGRTPKTNLLGSEVMGSMSVYGVGGSHRHTPEIRQIFEGCTDVPVLVSFTPTLAPMARGILAVCSAPMAGHISEEMVRAAYEQAYADEPFVHFLPPGQWPSTGATVGSNVAQVQVTIDTVASRLIAVSAIDNLTKGTAGQAIQCMNLMFGFSETLGLPMAGVAP